MSETLQAGAQASQWERDIWPEVGGNKKNMNNVSEV